MTVTEPIGRQTSTKGIARSIQRYTGLRYTDALRLVRERPEVLGDVIEVPRGGGLPLDIAASYVPLLEQLHVPGWRLINTGMFPAPFENTLTIPEDNHPWPGEPTRPFGRITVHTGAPGTPGVHRNAEEADGEVIDDLPDFERGLDPDVPLEQVAWLAMTVVPPEHGIETRFPRKGSQPYNPSHLHTWRWIAPGMPDYGEGHGLVIFNDAPGYDFIGAAADLINWFSGVGR